MNNEKPMTGGSLSEAPSSAEWEACAHQLAATLHGAIQSHQITLAERLALLGLL